MHPSYLGFQLDWPVFVKIPFTAGGKNLKRGEHFNWTGMVGVEADRVATLYAAGYIYHNTELEVQNKVGDRLSEMNGPKLDNLVNLLNVVVKHPKRVIQSFGYIPLIDLSSTGLQV